MMIKALLLIPFIGCIIAAIQNKWIEQYRQKMFDEWSKRVGHPDDRMMMRIINIVLGITIVTYIFFWPIILLVKLWSSIRPN